MSVISYRLSTATRSLTPEENPTAGITRDRIHSLSRDRRGALGRSLVAYLARKLSGYFVKEVTGYFRREPAMISQGIMRVENLLFALLTQKEGKSLTEFLKDIE